MKKLFFIISLLLCMAMFALPAMADCSHEAVLCDGTCTECWEQDLTPGTIHELVLCTGVCDYCGTKGLTPGHYDDPRAEVHDWDLVEKRYNETEHWEYCNGCGESIYTDSHYAYCTGNSTTCDWCGYVGLIERREHYDSTTYSDDTYHWEACEDCGEIFDKAEHYIFCDEIGEYDCCSWCGHEGVPANVDHGNSWYLWAHDEESHWKICDYCEEPLTAAEEHDVPCDGEGVCTICGETSTVDPYHYNKGELEWFTDDTQHWWICDGCGEEINREAHYASDDSGVCDLCGASFSAEHKHSWMDYADEENHWSACSECGYIEEGSIYPHYSFCDDPNVCMVCGSSYYGENRYHNWEYVTVNSTADKHWWECSICDITFDEEAHSVECKNPGVCASCGAECGDDVEVYHPWDSTAIHYDDTHHWDECGTCGEILDKSKHYSSCSAPEVCAYCEAPYNGNNVEHFEYEVVYDDTYHYDKCKGCGEILWMENHYILCTNPGKCNYCGAQCDSTDSVDHNLDYIEIRYDEDIHWEYCTYCEEEGYYSGEHYASCDALGVCAFCGKDYDGENVEHWADYDTMEYDDQMHWAYCAACGELAYEGTHHKLCTSDKNACFTCDYVGDNLKLSHRDYVINFDENAHWFYCKACDTNHINDTAHTLKDGKCGCGYTTNVKLAITKQPEDAWAYEGEKATVTVEAVGNDLTYQWYYKSGSKWKKASGTEASYSLTMTEDRDGRQMRCVITDAKGKTVTSDTVTLDTRFAATITTQPKDAGAYEGEKAKITVKATGDGLTYQWFYKAPDAAEWAKASGTKASYSLEMTEARNGRQMKCVVTDAYGNEVESDVVTLTTRYAAAIVTQPKDAWAYEGEMAVTTIEATGDGLTYQWYYKNPGSTKFKKSSITTAECAVEMTQARDGREMYCVVIDEYGNEVKSKTITLSIAKMAAITTQPKSVSIAKNKTAKFTVKAEGDGLKYQWFYQNPGEDTWKECSGTEATYSLKATTARNGRSLRCEITDAYGNTVTTKTVKLTVK